MKKAKIKSALKEIQQELTRMDIRISKLEPTDWIKYQDEALIGKKTESFHKQASMHKQETELKELPERWEVVITKENRNALNKYRMNVCGIKNHIPLKYERMTDDGSGNDKGNGSFREISFSDFERLVLKKEQEKEQTVKLELGEWYKDISGSCVMCITKLPEDDNENLSGYGLDNGVWFNDNNIKNENIWLPCDLEHVRKALTNYVKTIYGEVNYSIAGGKGDWYFSKGFKLLMHNGIWMHEVETSKEQQKEIDWSVPMLVESDKYVVQTTGKHDKTGFFSFCFSGVVIKNKDDDNKVGEYSENWNKKSFTPIIEPITINND